MLISVRARGFFEIVTFISGIVAFGSESSLSSTTLGDYLGESSGLALKETFLAPDKEFTIDLVSFPIPF